MSITWFLEPDVFSEDLDLLKDEILRQGHRVEEVKYIPFLNNEYDEAFYDGSTTGVFYGSLNMARFLQRVLAEHRPIIYCTMRNYDCHRYYVHFGKHLLNENYVMLPYGELLRRKEFLFETLGQDRALFIRPDTGDKSFTGQLLLYEDYERQVELIGKYDLPLDRLCVVAEPRNILHEWRFVVVEKKIVSCSPYKDSGPVLDGAMSLACEVASGGYEPDTCWTLDVCHTKEGEFRLLEIGSFSCAGLYKCHMEPIVREVSRVALAQYEAEK